MPCSDGISDRVMNYSIGEHVYLKTRLDNVTRYLCHIMSGNEPTPEILEWWKSHQIEDEKRRKIEELQNQINELKGS
jgi:hypothetical protein